MRKKALTAIEVSVVTSLPQANLVREVKKGAKKISNWTNRRTTKNDDGHAQVQSKYGRRHAD